MQAWLGANLGMATAMRVLDGGIGKVCGSRDACRLLHSALLECHRQLMKVRARCRMRVCCNGTLLRWMHLRAGLADNCDFSCCVQHDEKGSATALLHMCVKVSEKRFLLFFACLGDTEARLQQPVLQPA